MRRKFQEWMFDTGNYLIILGAYSKWFRAPIQWLGRFLMRNSGIRVDWFGDAGDDEIHGSLYEQLLRRGDWDVGSVDSPPSTTNHAP